MNYFKIILLVFTLVTLPAFSQTESSLTQDKITEKIDSLKEKLSGFDIEKWTDFSEKEKISYMSLKAEEIVLMLGPGFYHEDQKTIIEKDVVIKEGQSRNDNILGEKVYKVNFQKKADENKHLRYAATITFLKSTGKAYGVSFGNMMGLMFDTMSPYELYKKGVYIENNEGGLKTDIKKHRR